MNCMRVDPAPPERLVVHLCCTTCLVCFCHRRQQVKVVHCCCLSVVRGEPHQLLQTLLLALFLFSWLQSCLWQVLCSLFAVCVMLVAVLLAIQTPGAM